LRTRPTDSNWPGSVHIGRLCCGITMHVGACRPASGLNHRRPLPFWSTPCAIAADPATAHAQLNGKAAPRPSWARPSRDSPLGDAFRCKAVGSGARLIWDRTRTSQIGANTIVAPLFIGACPPYPTGHGDSHAARPCRRRNAAARSRPHCRQRHRCSLRSIRRLSCVSGCLLPQWLGISSRRTLRRSMLGTWTTAVLLVQSTPPLPRLSATTGGIGSRASLSRCALNRQPISNTPRVAVERFLDARTHYLVHMSL
jgi:hypothetical protein